MLKYQTSLRNGIIRVHGCCGVYAVAGTAAHKVAEQPPIQETIYPRHFGLIFLEKSEFDTFLQSITSKKIPFEISLKTRFENTKIEHQSFFLKDPSNNLLEFKHYTYFSAIFGEQDFKKVGEG